MFADVILPLPIAGQFTYSLPDWAEKEVTEGCRVVVPFGKNKLYTALITRLHESPPEGGYQTKQIAELLDKRPAVLPSQLSFWKWIADYYACSLGEVFKAAIPSGMRIEGEGGYKPKTESRIRLASRFSDERELVEQIDKLNRAKKQQEMLLRYIELSTEGEVPKRKLACISEVALNALIKKGVFELYTANVGRLFEDSCDNPVKISPLSSPQQQAFDKILHSFTEKDVCLLHGVTSSGKTQIYIHLINKALQEGKQVLYLLPEIALTTQLSDRLKQVFGDRLGVYHSKFPDAERVEIWLKQLSEKPYDVILGVRSSVFLPFTHLGLVIVDEEHETSYKQQDPAPRYHARNAAIVLARNFKAKTLLGSATPSIESYHNALTGKYAHVILNVRYRDLLLPHIEVVNIKELTRKKRMINQFSPFLVENIQKALANNEQVILFQNRRGFSPMIECHTCGWIPKCNCCDVSLTYHKNPRQLVCHYCGNVYPVPNACPACEGVELRDIGFGTEKVEDSVRKIFPTARIARLDLDSAKTRNAYERIIDDFERGNSDILIGTQMVSKGLDFDRVSVVGILNADSMLNYPDFRAYERAFQMMAQVAGRAGRKSKQGLVVLQTKQPDLPLIEQVVINDYHAMYEDQIAERRQFVYPPFCRLIYIYLKHRQEDVLEQAAATMCHLLKEPLGDRLLGAIKPPVSKVKEQFITTIIVKIGLNDSVSALRNYLLNVRQQVTADKRFRSLVAYFDMDPM